MPESSNERSSGRGIPITYTDAELKAYQRIVSDRRRRAAAPHGWTYWCPLIATGGVVALGGAALGVIGGLVPEREGNYLAVLVFAGFYIGAATHPLFSKWFWAKAAQADRDSLLDRTHRTSILLTDTGIFTRSSTARAFYPMSSIKNATQEDGLMLLWLRNGSALAIPIRVLNPGQHNRLLSLFSGTPDEAD